MTKVQVAGEARSRERARFDAISAGYDDLRFLHGPARRLCEIAAPAEGARVLDVATGTGAVAIVAGEMVGRGGRVTGIDFAPEMLRRAVEKHRSLGLPQVDFQQGDATTLPFSNESFDVVLCASSLFFIPDMLAVVREWRRVLKLGGLAGFVVYGPTFLQPLADPLMNRMRLHGLTTTPLPFARLNDPARCNALMIEGGFESIDVRTEQLGYHLPTSAARWHEIMAGLEGRPLAKFKEAERERIHAEHIAELDALATPDGIWIDVPAILTFGRK